MNLVENGIFNTEALKHSVKRLNQLGYFKQLEGNEGDQGREDAAGEEPGRRHAEAGRAEPQPAAVRRGLFAVRRHVPAVRVQTSELHGPRRNAVDVGADRRARCKDYQVSVHRAVPVRPADHRRRQRVQPEHRTSFQFTQETSGGNIMFGMPVKASSAGSICRLQPRDTSASTDLNLEFYDPETIATLRSVSGRRAADQAGRDAGRPPHHQQGHAELRLQHRRQSDLPVERARGSPRRSIWPAWAATRTYYKPTVELIKSASSTRAARRSASAGAVRIRRADRRHQALPYLRAAGARW